MMKKPWQNLNKGSIEEIVKGLKEAGFKLQTERHIQCSFVDFSRLTRGHYTAQYEAEYNERLGMESLLVPSELVGGESGEYSLYVRPKQQTSQ